MHNLKKVKSKRLKSWGLDGSDSIINQYFYRKFGIKANHLRKVLLLTKNASVKSFLLQKNKKKKDSRGLEAGRFHRWVSFWVILSATNNKNYVNAQLIDQIKRILLYLSSALELWFEDGRTSLASPTSNLCPTDNLLTRRKQYSDTGRIFFQKNEEYCKKWLHFSEECGPWHVEAFFYAGWSSGLQSSQDSETDLRKDSKPLEEWYVAC